jgi:heme/copper-type cytochrome/quinol oxidase subunit 1
MKEQNYANHHRYVFMFHVVLFSLVVLTFIGSLVNLYESCGNHERIYSASLIAVISFCLLLFFFFCRQFPLKAQDRAIRAEENLRHFALTGKLFDARLTMKQILALRFAGDDEFLALAQKAVDEQLSADAIKKAVKHWRADRHRA